ncbi:MULTISPECIES: monovalent cation/H(+) antiporter subunit G [Kocuria]|uniref:monovalent cation/H(+) antiporter subunit G n=1 Tax=Kocuria TaxID=57493 RepID=UPI00080A82C7|nr:MULTISPECIES: monovalent cation/H(+) antiporter subunit G [Kocuria]MCT1368192.1 monovalent cation/H(+) antiporter subunit G [Rothia sp. p3-SID1597]RUQ23244.1 monovalent cation/H(+) antiporter subunit G [Kocuria sp. HSID16901]
MLDTVLNILTGACLIVGCLMSLGAALGIMRFSDVLSRLHPGAKPQVFGLFLLLLGMGIAARSWSLVPALILAWTLQMLATPVSSHMVGRSGFRNRHFAASSLTVNELADLVEQMNREEEQEQAPAEAAPEPREVDADTAGLDKPDEQEPRQS